MTHFFSWNEIISTSSSTQKKFNWKFFDVEIQGKKILWIDEFDKIVKFRRKFFNVSIGLMEEKHAIELFIKLLERRGGETQNLKIRNGMFSYIEALIEILKNTPNLETIRYEHCYVTKEKPKTEKIPTLKNLKSLTSDHSCYGIFEYFAEAPIKNLMIKISTDIQLISRIDSKSSKFMEKC